MRIHKRGSTWYYAVDVGNDPLTGKRKQKTQGGFRTKKEAEAACASLLAELNKGTYIEEKNTLFKDFSTTWLEGYKQLVKISTVRVREHELGHLLTYFSQKKIKSITKKMYQDAFNDLKVQNLADSTLEGIHSTGRMIFKKAVELGVIAKDPTEFFKLPKTQKTVDDLENEELNVKYLEKEELAKFLKTAQEKGLFGDIAMFVTLAYSGMRAGELCALKWKDINFDEQTIRITKTYYNPKNKVKEFILLTPKTSTSIRTIDVAPIVLDELRKHKARQNELRLQLGTEFYYDDFVFTKTDKNAGYPEITKTLGNRMRRLLRIAGLNQNLTPHSLRHTHTSLLAEAGVSLETIMERLGHKDDEITRTIYMHITKPMKKEASHKFSELMRSFL
ncbi:site-specific integrase [Paenibacillus marinisediminis]